MALVDPGDIDDWIGRAISANRQDEVTSTIAYAQSWVAQSAGLRSLEKEAASVTTYFDGADVCGEFLWLPMDMRPVWHSGSDLVSIVEDAISLNVSSIASTTIPVILTNANTYKRARLYKAGGWSKATPQNIAVTCKVGFDSDPSASVLPVPQYVRRLVMEVAWLMFNSPQWIGHSSTSKAGSAATVENALSLTAREGLERLRGL